MTVSRSSSRDLRICLLIVLAGFALRAYGSAALDLWGDEAFSWMQANRSFDDVLAATAKDNYPPLHNIILHFTIGLLGDSAITLRAPSVLMGTLTIYIVYLAGKEVWGWRVGLVAALLLASSPLHIWHSIEARMYALFCLTSTLYLFASFQFLTNGRGSTMLACLSTGVLTLYSHVFGSLVFVAVNAAVLACFIFKLAEVKPKFLTWVLVQFATLVAFLPWLVFLLERAKSVAQPGRIGISWIPAPTPDHLANVAMQLIGGPYVLVALIAIAGISRATYFRGGRDSSAEALRDPPAIERQRLATVLCVFCAAVPPLIALGISFVFTPFILSRYLISTLPVVFLLLARFMSRAFADARALLVALAAILLGVVFVLPRIASAGWIKPVRPDLASFQRLRSAGDRVLYLGWDWPLFNYYVRNRQGIETYVPPEIPMDNTASRRIWLVNLDRNDDHGMAARLRTSGYRETYHATTPLILFSLFEK